MNTFRTLVPKIAMVLGIITLVLTVGLLAYLYSGAGQAKIEIPKVATPLPPGHAIALCRDVPRQGLDNLERVMDYGRQHGIVYGAVHADGCSNFCNHEGRVVPCTKGEITLSLRDGAFSEDHCGETIWAVDENNAMTWATILLPEKCFPPEDGGRFPKDAYAIVLAHELIIHAEGRGHTRTEIAKGIVTEKTGELANANLTESGWGDAGW